MSVLRGPLAGFVGSLLTVLSAAAILVFHQPKVQVVSPEQHTPEFQRAFFDAATVYGKTGCGDQALTERTARYSLASGVPAKIIAAAISSESSCNPLAVSNRGAIGLMQIMPKVWSSKFDFTKFNLFNPEDNMTVGTAILSKYIHDYGVKNALVRYYGTGQDNIGLGGVGYATKVLQLAGKL